MTYVPQAEALEHPLRALMVRLIERHPGIRLAQLAATLDLENSTLVWHLGKLQSAGLIHRLKDPRARAYWAASGGQEAKHLAAQVACLNTDRKVAMLACIVDEPGVRAADAAERVDVSANLARQIARMLETQGLLRRVPEAAGHRFYATSDAAPALAATWRIHATVNDQAGKSAK